MNRLSLLLVVPALALATTARADFYSHRYGGISYGNMDLSGFCAGADKFVQSLGSTEQDSQTLNCSDSGNGWKIYGGWRWTPQLAVEGSYQQLAASTLDFQLRSNTSEYLVVEDEIKTQLINAFVVGHWPILEGVSLFAKVGGGLWISEISERQSGELLFTFENEAGELEDRLVPVSTRAYDSDTGIHLGYGAGISYRHGNRWTLRAEWEGFSNVGSEDFRSEYDVESASLGLSIHF